MTPKHTIAMILALSTVSCASTGEHRSQMAQDTKNLGEAYLNQGNYAGALKELLDAEKIIPDDPYLHNDLGLVYMARGRYGLAEEHFTRAVALKPDYVPAQNNLGTALLRQEKWDQAITCYREIVGNLLYATPHFALTNLGWAYLGKKDFRKAKENFSKALDIKPDFVNAVHGLATAYLSTGQADSVENLLGKSLQKNPEAAILHADLARALEATRQYARAKQAWKMVIKLAPETDLAREADHHLNP
ncbi:MAG: tetratricopeptide repeat protein [Pseudomonadota bacterium]